MREGYIRNTIGSRPSLPPPTTNQPTDRMHIRDANGRPSEKLIHLINGFHPSTGLLFCWVRSEGDLERVGHGTGSALNIEEERAGPICTS